MALEVRVGMSAHAGMKVKDAAKYYDVTPRTIYHWIKKGAIEATRVGNVARTGVRVKCSEKK